MTEKEMVKVLIVISEIWSNFNFIPSNTGKIKTWHRIIGDISYKDAETAIYKIANIKTDGFAPSPGEIRAVVTEALNPQLTKTGEEAWEEVMKAISGYGFYRQKELLDSLEARTRKALKCVGVYNALTSTKPEFIKKDFIKYYNDCGVKEFKEEAISAFISYDLRFAALGEAPESEGD